jgi:hypothetical protein
VEAVELLDPARAVVQYIAEHSPAELRTSFLALLQVSEIMAKGVWAKS